MTTAYTGLLGLALPVTGELSGTWGDTVNNYLTQYVDAAIAGAQVISGSQTAVTLSTTNGIALSQAGSGATGSSQYAIINCTGNPASLLTVTAPASSKAYIVINGTSTSQSVKVVGAGPTTGVTMVSGEKAIIAWNGSDFVKVASTVVNLSSVTGTLSVANGGTSATATPTAGAIAYGTGTAYAFNTAGSSGQPLLSGGSGVPTFGTLGVAAGGTGQTTYTDGQLLIGNSSGNTLTKTTLTAGSNVTITNGPGTITIAASSAAQVYPGAGIANSTGSAWGTSYSTSGGGTVVQLARKAVSVIGTNTSAAAYTTYVLTASLTLTLPSSPTAGDWIAVQNISATTTPVIGRNGQNIMGLAEDLTVDSDTASFTLTFADATRGWVLTL